MADNRIYTREELERGAPSSTTVLSSTEINDDAYYAANLSPVAIGTEPKDTPQIYSSIKSELEQGESVTLDSIRGQLAAQRSALLQDVKISELVAETMDAEARANQITQDDTDVVDLGSEYQALLAADSDYEVLPEFFEYLEWEHGGRQEFQALNLEETSADFPEAMGGFLEVLVPFNEQIRVAQAGGSIDVDNPWYMDFLALGHAKENIREALINMPLTQRIEAEKSMIRLIGTMGGGGFKKRIYFEQLTGGDYATWEKWVDNAISILDYAAVGGGLRALKGSSAVAKMTEAAKSSKHVTAALNQIKMRAPGYTKDIPSNRPIIRTENGDEEFLHDIVVAALNDDTGKLGIMVGATKPELLARYIMPKQDGMRLKEMTDEIRHSLEAQTDDLTQLGSRLEEGGGINFQFKEKVEVARKAWAAMRDNTVVELQVNKSYIQSDGNRIYGTAIYGNPKAPGGFHGYEQAVQFAKASGIPAEELELHFRVDGIKDLVKLELSGKELLEGISPRVLPRSSSFSPVTKFYIGQRFDHKFDRLDAALYGQDAVSKLGRGQHKNYLLDITARTKKWFSDAALRAGDVGTQVEKTLMDRLGESLASLSGRDQAKVNSAIQDGASRGKVFAPDELELKFKLDEKQQRAYYQFRRANDLVWAIGNRTFARKLKRDGFGSKIEGMDRFAKPAEVASVRGYVLDGKTNELVDVKTIPVADRNFLEMDTTVIRGPIGTKYVKADSVKLERMPDNPLPYRVGDFYQTARDLYVLRAVPNRMNVNGVELAGKELEAHTEVILTGNSRDTLERHLGPVSASLDDYTVSLVRADEARIDTSALAMRTGGNIYSASGIRNKHIGGAVPMVNELDDPIDGLFSATRMVSKYAGMEDFLEVAKQRWLNTYSEGLRDPKTYPRNVEDISKATLGDDWGNAVALYETIANMRIITPKSDAVWRNVMLNITEALEKRIPVVGEATRAVARRSPTQELRRIPTALFIAFNPIRQLVLQPSQLAQLAAIDPKFMLNPNGFARQITAMSGVRGTWTMGDKFKEAGIQHGASVSGMPVEEFREVARVYMEESGLPFSIDSHAFIEGQVSDITKTLGYGNPLKWYRGVRDTSKRFGFDAGEFLNLTGSWLFARERWLKANPGREKEWATRENLDIISADGRAISYAMTQPGTLGYQRGLLSVIMQFASVPHKAMASMLPQALGGSNTYTAMEKARLAAFNTLMFGGIAGGFDWVIDAALEESGVDLPDNVKLQVKGGLLDMMVNGLINGVSTDDDTFIKFSDSFSPVAREGVPGANFWVHMLDNNWIEAAGPTVSGVRKLKTAFEDITFIAGLDTLDTPEKLERSVRALINTTSGGSNTLKAHAAWITGQLVSANGTPIAGATRAEALAKLFGLQTYDEELTFKLLNKIKDNEEMATLWANHFKKQYEVHDKLYETDKARWRSNMEQLRAARSALPPELYHLVAPKIQGSFARQQSTAKDNAFKAIVRSVPPQSEIRQEVIDILRSNAVGGDVEHLIQLLELKQDG